MKYLSVLLKQRQVEIWNWLRPGTTSRIINIATNKTQIQIQVLTFGFVTGVLGAFSLTGLIICNQNLLCEIDCCFDPLFTPPSNFEVLIFKQGVEYFQHQQK
jgi:hypothetical protein